MSIYDDSLKQHYMWKGKFETRSRVEVDTNEKLMLAYTPGVAQACLEIQKDVNKSYELTRRWNSVAIITDGTAILGLGDIGPEAGMPVMEGKAALFKTFGDVDCFPLCLRTKDTDEIVRTIQILCGSFGGINLKDISAPRCFEIERRLKETCDIPVFHDDQHGTAIVVGAATINALKIVNKKISDITCVVNGAGAAGISIGKFLLRLGVKDVIFCDKQGIIYEGMDNLNPAQEEVSHISNKRQLKGLLKDALVGADLFVGVSAPRLVTREMISSMAKDPIVFPLANPVPEITPEEAKLGGARIIGTGSSQYPNQINNVLVFPGVFRGALDARAKDINMEMMIAASKAIASMVDEKELNENYIIPSAVNVKVHEKVAQAVKEMAIETHVNRI